MGKGSGTCEGREALTIASGEQLDMQLTPAGQDTVDALVLMMEHRAKLSESTLSLKDFLTMHRFSDLSINGYLPGYTWQSAVARFAYLRRKGWLEYTETVMSKWKLTPAAVDYFLFHIQA